MSMRMRPEDLEMIASKVRELEKVGIDVKKFRVPNHDIYLDSASDESLIIVGISNRSNEDEEPPRSILQPRRR